MKTATRITAACLLFIAVAPVWADEYQETVEVFRKAVESKGFFDDAYGYAVFPIVGKGGVGIGGAYGTGRVYAQGQYVGDTTMTQVTLGFQFGGQAYRQIVFFEDRHAFRQFTSGNFEFGAQASAVAVTAGAQAAATTAGSSAGASGTEDHAITKGRYRKGMAVFTVARGGLMYEASIGGQKFSYTPRQEGKQQD